MSITEHKFFDPEVEEVIVSARKKVELWLDEHNGDHVILTRNDTIALAKHFGLTEEDLRDV